MKDPTTIDTHFIKLHGKGNIPQGLEIGHNYTLQASGTITTKTESDNDDGSHSHYYKFEPVLIEVVTDKGERIRAKDTRGSSQQLRASLKRIYSFKTNINIEFEEWYKRGMANLIKFAPELVEMYFNEER